MAYKTVIRLDLKCSKCKKVALRSVTKIEGIESLTINIHESTLTVIGDADPVCMIQLLKKKFCCVHLVCYGSWPPPPEKPKEEDEKPKDQKSKDEKPKDQPKDEKPHSSEPQTASAAAASSAAASSSSTFILYHSPCNCRPPPTFPCTPPPAWKPPECCPRGLSCSCRLEKCCPTSCPCPNKSEIMWPQYHNPLAPDEVWYVWKEEQQESCTIM